MYIQSVQRALTTYNSANIIAVVGGLFAALDKVHYGAEVSGGDCVLPAKSLVALEMKMKKAGSVMSSVFTKSLSSISLVTSILINLGNSP